MRRLFSPRVIWCLLSLSAILALPARSADLVYRPPTGGLQISLTTNVTKVWVGGPTSDTIMSIKKDRRIMAPVRSLIANVALANRGNEAVSFNFLDRAAAERKFRFKIFNSEGTLVWESESDPVEEAAQVEVPLVKRSPWRRSINVPLWVNGTWLASGRYTLEASVDATDGIGATSVFEVMNSGGGYIQPPPNTGIKGAVVEATPTALDGEVNPDPAQSTPLKGAYVTVKEILPPFSLSIRAPYTWSGYTDAQGRFTAPTPVGLFKVTASRVAIRAGTEPHVEETQVEVASDASTVDPSGAGAVVIGRPIAWPGPINLSVSKEVEVALGQYTETTLVLPKLQYPAVLQQVYSVDEVTAVPLQTLVAPATVLITAKGTVTSGGWSNAQLVQRRPIPWLPLESDRLLPMPIDVLEFDFVATPPRGPATTVMSPITATKEIVVPEGIREIRVHSKTKSLSAALPQEP